MKKVFNLLVSFVLIAGFSACSKDDSGNQQVPKNPVPSADYKGLAFISSGESTVRLAQVGTPYEISLEAIHHRGNDYFGGQYIFTVQKRRT